MRYLTLATLLCLDLFVFARLDKHPVQWMFLAFTTVIALGLVIHLQSRPKEAKELKENSMGSANAWMLTPAVFFVLKLLSNSAYTAFGNDISKDAQGYFFLSILFWFSTIFLGLAIGSSVNGNKLSNSLAVAFFGILFFVSFLFFLFVLLLAFDESCNNWRF